MFPNTVTKEILTCWTTNSSFQVIFMFVLFSVCLVAVSMTLISDSILFNKSIAMDARYRMTLFQDWFPALCGTLEWLKGWLARDFPSEHICSRSCLAHPLRLPDHTTGRCVLTNGNSRYCNHKHTSYPLASTLSLWNSILIP